MCRADAAAHEAVCAFAPVACQFCHAEVLRGGSAAHEAECGALVACTYAGCGATLRKCQQDAHNEQEWPLHLRGERAARLALQARLTALGDGGGGGRAESEARAAPLRTHFGFTAAPNAAAPPQPVASGPIAVSDDGVLAPRGGGGGGGLAPRRQTGQPVKARAPLPFCAAVLMGALCSLYPHSGDRRRACG